MRLIDADAYIKYCEDHWIPLNVDAVVAQPTVDDVPVVRCRECNWCEICPTGQHLGLDGFCSKGERNE